MFFRPPEPLAVWALKNSAGKRWDKFVEMTKSQLLDVLENRKTLDLRVDARVWWLFLRSFFADDSHFIVGTHDHYSNQPNRSG
jgi:hypothetical protein